MLKKIVFLLFIINTSVLFSNINQQLFEAVENNNIQLAETLISQGANVNYIKRHDSTPLIKACSKGSLEMVKLLVSSGAQVNPAEKEAGFPLFKAIYYEHFEIVTYLVGKGADINKKDYEGNTPALKIALTSENIEIITYLIENGADYTLAKPGYADNGFFYAVERALKNKEFIPVIKLLLKKGADINKADSRYNTPLLKAVYTERRNSDADFVVTKLLIENGADCNQADEDGQTPLLLAARYNHTALVKYLVDRGAAVDGTSYSKGKTALLYAAREGNLELVNFLLEKGAYINAIDHGGNTLLKYLIEKKADLNTFQHYVKKGADIHLGKEGGTVLTKACRENNFELVKYLVESGDDVNETDEDLNTAVIEAASNSFELVEYLVLKGANINVENEDGYTPLSRAVSRNNRQLVNYLLDAGIKDIQKNSFGPVLVWACEKNYLEIVKKLIDKKADINYSDGDGLTAAIEKGNMELIKLLVTNKADVNIPNGYSKNTPIFYAVEEKRVDIVQYLVEMGATINQKNKYDETALITACKAAAIDIVKYLIESGADPSIANKEGKTAMDTAKSVKNIEIVEYLKQFDVGNFNHDLQLASMKGDINKVLEALEKGADIETTGLLKKTPLTLAARMGHEDVVKLLLKKEASLSESTLFYTAVSNQVSVMKVLLAHISDIKAYSSDPLLAAVERNNDQIAVMLLEKGMHPDDAADKYGLTPLLIGAKTGRLELVKSLLAHGALINQEGYCEKNALWFAVKYSRYEVARYLLANKISTESGRNSYYSSSEDNDLISIAVDNNDRRILQLLLENEVYETKLHYNNFTLLTWASFHGYDEIITYLLKNGFYDIHKKDKSNRNALHWAAKLGRHETVRLLISRGADIEAQDGEGNTSLILAARDNQLKTAKLLLDHKTQVNRTNMYGKTAFLFAAALGYKDMCELLINHGAGINTADRHGRSGLTYAVQYGKKEIIDLLFSHDVPIETDRIKGSLLFYYAVTKGNEKVLNRLFKEGYKPDTTDFITTAAFLEAVKKGRKATVSVLIQKGINVNCTDEKGRTPLINSIRSGHDEIFSLLLNSGADIHVLDTDGFSAAAYAVQKGNIQICKSLFKKGANKNYTTADGKTLTMLAAQSGQLEVLNFLITSGADVNKTDKEGNSALIIAAQNEHTESALYLLNNSSDSTIENKNGYTVFDIAIRNGQAALVKVLIEKKQAAVKSYDYDSYIKRSIEYKYFDLAFYLISLSQIKSGQYLKQYFNKHYNSQLTQEERAQQKIIVRQFLEVPTGTDVKILKMLLKNWKFYDLYDLALYDYVQNAEDPRLEQQLIKAVIEGNLETVKKVIEKGADVENNSDSAGFTAIFIAAGYGRKEIVEYLHSAGAALDAYGPDNISLFEYALLRKQPRIASYIFEQIVEYADKEQLVFTASKYGAVDCIKELVKYNIDINREFSDEAVLGYDYYGSGSTSLEIASLMGHLEAVKLLYSAGADLRHDEERNPTALILAAIGNHYDIAEYLLSRGHITCPDHFYNIHIGKDKYKEFTPLFYAALKGNSKMTDLLLNNNADPYKRSPINGALAYGQLDIIKLFAARNISFTNKQVNRIISRADEKKDFEFAQLIMDRYPVLIKDSYDSPVIKNEHLFKTYLSKKGDTNRSIGFDLIYEPRDEIDLSGLNLLFLYDFKTYDISILHSVLSKIIKSYNYRYESHFTGLMSGIFYEYPYFADANLTFFIESLIKSEQSYDDFSSFYALFTFFLNSKVKDRAFEQALKELREEEKKHAVDDKTLAYYKYLTDNLKENLDSDFLNSIHNQDLEKARQLLKNGAAINAKNFLSQNALFYAAQKGDDRLLDFLIQNGADTGQRDKTGKTALHHGVINNQISSVKLLIKSQSDINTQDTHGLSPLMYAVLAGNQDMVKFLLDNGANSNSRTFADYYHQFDNAGPNNIPADSTALSIARDYRFIEIIKILSANSQETTADSEARPYHKGMPENRGM